MQSKAKKMNLEKEYMSKEEVCTFLGITNLTLSSLIQRGHITAIKPNSTKGKLLFLNPQIQNLHQQMS